MICADRFALGHPNRSARGFLSVAHGEKSFFGASGAGKRRAYTLAGWSAGIGEVEFKGTAFPTARDFAAQLRNKKMGFVFQGYFLLPELTALENVMLPGMISGDRKRTAAEASLSDVGLADRLHHLPAELSGGEQQRVAIARALTNDPDIVFADEPTGNLDSKTGDAIIDLLSKWCEAGRRLARGDARHGSPDWASQVRTSLLLE